MMRPTRLIKATLLVFFFLVGCSSPDKEREAGGVATFRSVVGAAMFGIQSEHYPCDLALSMFDGVKYKMTSVLSHTFGENKDCLRRFINLPAAKTHVQIYFENGAGRRNRNLRPGELFPHLTAEQYSKAWEKEDLMVVRAYEGRILEWLSFTEEMARENLTFSAVMVLEDNLSLDAAENMANAALDIWPYELGWNPENYYGPYSFVDVEFVELHGDRIDFPSGTPCRSNLDGLQPTLGRGDEFRIASGRVLRDADLYHWIDTATRYCDFVQIWDKPISNGGYPGDPWSDPRSRSFPMDPIVVRFVNELLLKYNGKL